MQFNDKSTNVSSYCFSSNVAIDIETPSLIMLASLSYFTYKYMSRKTHIHKMHKNIDEILTAEENDIRPVVTIPSDRHFYI